MKAGSSQLLLILAVAALLTLPGCAQWGKAEYVSVTPPFHFHYPASWQVSQKIDRYGPMIVLSPDAKLADDSPRVTVQPTQAEAQQRLIGKGTRPADLIMTADAGLQPNGQMATRWFVANFPTGYLVEAYANPGDFDRIHAVGQAIANELAQPVKEEPATIP